MLALKATAKILKQTFKLHCAIKLRVLVELCQKPFRKEVISRGNLCSQPVASILLIPLQPVGPVGCRAVEVQEDEADQ